MHSRTPHKLLFLALLLATGVSLAASLWPEPGVPEGNPQTCALGLGETASGNRASIDGQFSVLSWNLQKSIRPDWRQDLARLGGETELAFIQEAARSAGIEAVLPARSAAFAAGYRTNELETGVLTLSQTPALLECDLQAMEPWLGTPKAIAVTEYPLTGRDERLLTINIHAVNFTLGLEDYQAQLGQLDEVLKSHAGPAIVAGDFNTWRAGRRHALESLMNRHKLTGVHFEPDHRSRFLGEPLDHIFIRGLTASAPRTIPVTSSDHNPLLVSLRLE